MRTYVRVGIRMMTPWRIGAWESAADNRVTTLTDLLVALAPGEASHPMIPGSSVAGALRHAAGQAAEQIFGPPPGDDVRQVSPWWVLGVHVADSEVVVRGRTKISRRRGAAENRGRFDAEEVAPCSARIYLRGDNVEVQPLIDVLQAWAPRLGAGRTIGMGRLEVTEIRHRTLDLANKADVLEWLSATGSPADRVDSLLTSGVSSSWRGPVAEPYLTAVLAVPFLAITSEGEDRTPGSTWKGLLRSRVEYIGRSMGYDVCGLTPEEWHGCGHCAVCAAFGSSEKPGTLEVQESPWRFAPADIPMSGPPPARGSRGNRAGGRPRRIFRPQPDRHR